MRVVERGDVVVDGGLGFSLARPWSTVNGSLGRSDLVLFQLDGPNRVHAVERMTQLRKRGSRGSRERRERTAKRIVLIPHSFSTPHSAIRISL